MEKISNRIFQIIKIKDFADPFSIEYDHDKLIKEFGTLLNKDESNILNFIYICNSYYKVLKQRIFSTFDELKLTPVDLREFFFISVNKYYLDLTPKLVEQLDSDISFEAEKATFSKITNRDGQEVNAQFAVEIAGDILAELINFSYQWKDGKREWDSLNKHDSEVHGRLFHALWIYMNIFYNLKNSVFSIVKYENGKVVFKDNDCIKIENGLEPPLLFRNVGIIRFSNNIQEFFASIANKYRNTFINRIGVDGYEINENVLTAIRGKSDTDIIAKADSNIFVFYPHYINDKLEYFDGLSLHDLLNIIVLVEECLLKLHEKNIVDYQERKLSEVPIKFNETELVGFLALLTGNNDCTVRKVINSLTCNTDKPCFWRQPFTRVGNFLFFSLPAIIAPNHCLYLDKWTALSGFSLEDKEERFAKFVYKELAESNEFQYRFDLLNLELLKLDLLDFRNTILIETTSLRILLEIKVFDFPIESSEIDLVLNRLGKATLNVDKKLKQIEQNFNDEKEFVKIILTNYPNFSGLQINDIPITDLTLFKNYVLVGKLRKSTITFSEDRTIVNEVGHISYYNTEDEFNTNFVSFFVNPLPIRNIIDRLYLRELQIMPSYVKHRISIDIIDHLSEDDLMNSRIENLSSLLNYEYFNKPEEEEFKNSLDQSIVFSLSGIFNKISFAPYESYKDRIELYYSISRTKMLGFVHLAFYILDSIKRLNGKKIGKAKYFKTVNYDVDKVIELLKKEKIISGKIRISEFKINRNVFTEVEERKIISFAIDILSTLSPKSYDDDTLESFLLPLSILHGLSSEYDIEFEFYSACANIIDALNHAHKYQPARDLCEELLLLAIKDNRHSHGWNLLFRCYTNQKNIFDASIYGCLFLTSILVLPEIPNFLAVESLYGALKYFRNFGFLEFAKYTYENLQHFDLNEFDKQKVTLSYFNSFLHGDVENDVDVLNQVVDYVDVNIDSIIRFKENGVIPWLALFYNIERLKATKQIKYNKDIKKYIHTFESSIDKRSVDDLRNKIMGSNEKIKDIYISAVLNVLDTRSVIDFVYEVRHLAVIASNLLQSAIVSNDIDGILLAGLTINDQTFTFKTISIAPGSILPVSKPKDQELKLRLSNYKNYLLSKIVLKFKQLFLWIFEDLNRVYVLIINSQKECEVLTLENWDINKMKQWLSNITNFYFNAKKNNDGKVICKFSNPRAESDYNNLVQEEDYRTLINELIFSNIGKVEDFHEIFICTSIDMACFPHNLLEVKNDFIAAQCPVCNVVSIERFLENSSDIFLSKSYSISAWIPIDDKQFVVEMGYQLLKPTLDKYKANIYTTTYPNNKLITDLNIFLAHGVVDNTGFKAVYTNPEQRKAIAYPFEVFGNGKVAILFICNSGSSKEALFSNNVVSFSCELLKNGYDAVIAPFWPFDYTMSNIWLKTFLEAFNVGFSINESVFLANNRLSEYDEETSNMFYAPAGCLAMHLFGNPHIYS